MKLILLCLTAVLFCLNTNAQKEIPDYGKIDKSDLEMKECDFDKDAEAYRLIDYGNVKFERGKTLFKVKLQIRERIKILKEKGMDEASVKIHFYSKDNLENVKDISAITYNLDNSGNVVTSELEKSSVYTKKINNKYSEVVFTMPQVKVGSVIEYRYTKTTENPEYIPDWFFQNETPTRISQYQITVPQMLHFVCQVLAYQKVEQQNKVVSERITAGDNILDYNSIVKTYTLKQIPALRNEVFMRSPNDYLQRVQFQLSQVDWGDGSPIEILSSWEKLTSRLLDAEDFGLQLKKNIPRTSDLDNQLKNITDNYKKMVVIHDYVKRNMNANGIEDIYATDGIKSIWDKKSGSTTDINLILINLLRDAGLEAYPVLVSTRDNGSVNKIYPFLNQFNNAMAYVVIDDKNYVLNAADKYNPARLIPYDVINTDGYLIDKIRGGWITISNNKQIFKNAVSIFAEITPDGVLDGEATVYSYDYSRNPKVKRWKENNTGFKDYFTKDYTSMKVEDIEVNNLEDETLPFEQKFKFQQQLNSSGDYKYFTINLFNGLEKNPFIADERQTDIDFGYNQSFAVYGNITLPAGYKLEEVPKNLLMITPDTGIVLKRIMQLDGDVLSIRLNLDFKKPVYSIEEYPAFKEFYKKLYATLNEQLVIKKK